MHTRGATPNPDPPAGSRNLPKDALDAAVQGELSVRFESGPGHLS